MRLDNLINPRLKAEGPCSVNKVYSNTKVPRNDQTKPSSTLTSLHSGVTAPTTTTNLRKAAASSHSYAAIKAQMVSNRRSESTTA